VQVAKILIKLISTWFTAVWRSGLLHRQVFPLFYVECHVKLLTQTQAAGKLPSLQQSLTSSLHLLARLLSHWFTAKWPLFSCLSVCLFVCAEFFSAVFDPILIKLGHVICLGLVVFLEYRGCATPGGWVTPKTCIFRGFGAQKTIWSYSYDGIVLIFGYIVERTNTKILSSHFCQFPSWTQIMTS